MTIALCNRCTFHPGNTLWSYKLHDLVFCLWHVFEYRVVAMLLHKSHIKNNLWENYALVLRKSFKKISIDNQADIPSRIGMRDHFCSFSFRSRVLEMWSPPICLSLIFTARKKISHCAISQCATPLSDRQVLPQSHKS